MKSSLLFTTALAMILFIAPDANGQLLWPFGRRPTPTPVRRPPPKARPVATPTLTPTPIPQIPVALPNYDEETSTRLQIFLDNNDFGPGKIDGQMGEFFRKAR